MEITETFYAPSRKEWRAWLKKNHSRKKEVWLVYYNKQSGHKRIPYHEAVEEAICFGWIDSTVKKIDDSRSAQRFTPRRTNSPWSELNKERARRMIKNKKMTGAGRKKLGDAADVIFRIPQDLLKAVKSDEETWKHFTAFPESYKHIRLGFIDASRNRPEFFKKRLQYFLKMTKQNKRFGSEK
jgi:uncharacterized protein YdeI (YjbR/CyaY-like superfamily)